MPVIRIDVNSEDLRWRRKVAFVDEALTKCNRLGIVQAKHPDGDSANGRSTDQDRPTPAKAAAPMVAEWIEQLHEFPGLRIEAADVGPFE